MSHSKSSIHGKAVLRLIYILVAKMIRTCLPHSTLLLDKHDTLKYLARLMEVHREAPTHDLIDIAPLSSQPFAISQSQLTEFEILRPAFTRRLKYRGSVHRTMLRDLPRKAPTPQQHLKEIRLTQCIHRLLCCFPLLPRHRQATLPTRHLLSISPSHRIATPFKHRQLHRKVPHGRTLRRSTKQLQPSSLSFNRFK